MAGDRVHGEDFADVLFGQGVAFVDDEVVREAGVVAVLHCGEVAERVRVAERAVLAEALLQVGSLHVVEAAGVAAVVAGEDPSVGVDLDAERVAPPFGEDFVAFRFGVVAPDVLPLREDAVLLARSLTLALTVLPWAA